MNTYFKIGSNLRERNTQIHRDAAVCDQRVDILYSYDTPVAVYDRAARTLYITTMHHSQTTQRHINKWSQSTRFGSDVERCVMTQDALWELHHKASLWEAQQAGVTA